MYKYDIRLYFYSSMNCGLVLLSFLGLGLVEG